MIKALQNNPYDYTADETEDDLNECQPKHLDKPYSYSFLFHCSSIEYNPNIPYSSIKKLGTLGQGSYGSVYKAYNFVCLIILVNGMGN